MRTTDKFTEFQTRFLQLAGQACIPSNNLMPDLFDKLTLELRCTILPQYSTITSFKQLTDQCQAVDQGLRRIKAEERTKELQSTSAMYLYSRRRACACLSVMEALHHGKLRPCICTNCICIQSYVEQCTKTPEPQNGRRCDRPFPDPNQHGNLPVGNLRRSVLCAECMQGIPAPYYEVVRGVHRLLHSVPSPCRQRKDSGGRPLTGPVQQAVNRTTACDRTYGS